MEMTWYKEASSDMHNRFTDYLEKVSKLKKYSGPKAQHKKEIIRDLILPILRDGNGWIPEELDRVEALAKNWGLTNWDLANIIHRHWKMMNKSMTAIEAAKLMKLSPGTMRRWARDEVVHADVDDKGHWSFTREVLIDLLD